VSSNQNTRSNGQNTNNPIYGYENYLNNYANKETFDRNNFPTFENKKRPKRTQGEGTSTEKTELRLPNIYENDSSRYQQMQINPYSNGNQRETVPYNPSGVEPDYAKAYKDSQKENYDANYNNDYYQNNPIPDNVPTYQKLPGIQKNNYANYGNDGSDGYVKSLEQKIELLMEGQESLKNKINSINTNMYRDKEVIYRIESKSKKWDEMGETFLRENDELKKRVYDLIKDEESKDWNFLDKFRAIEAQIKEVQMFVQSEKLTGLEEMSKIKSILEEKIENDKQIMTRDKEKARALFNELIRLGEQQEKYISNFNANHSQNETRLQMLERKLLNFEKMSTEINIINNSIKEEITNFTEKIGIKFAQLEKDNVISAVSLLENPFASHRANQETWRSHGQNQSRITRNS